MILGEWWVTVDIQLWIYGFIVTTNKYSFNNFSEMSKRNPEYEHTKKNKSIIIIDQAVDCNDVNISEWIKALCNYNSLFWSDVTLCLFVWWWLTPLSQVTDKLYHIMLYTSPWSRFKFNISGDRHWLHR